MSKSISNSGPNPPQQGSIAIPKSRRGFKGFLNEVKREANKIDWPAPKETTRLTGIVLAVCGMIVAVLFGLSEVVDIIITQLLGRGGH